jgi:hypothetical protein
MGAAQAGNIPSLNLQHFEGLLQLICTWLHGHQDKLSRSAAIGAVRPQMCTQMTDHVGVETSRPPRHSLKETPRTVAACSLGKWKACMQHPHTMPRPVYLRGMGPTWMCPLVDHGFYNLSATAVNQCCAHNALDTAALQICNRPKSRPNPPCYTPWLGKPQLVLTVLKLSKVSAVPMFADPVWQIPCCSNPSLCLGYIVAQWCRQN